jgi:hypothetical protein
MDSGDNTLMLIINALSEFKRIFATAKEITNAVGIRVEAPRVVPH